MQREFALFDALLGSRRWEPVEGSWLAGELSFPARRQVGRGSLQVRPMEGDAALAGHCQPPAFLDAPPFPAAATTTAWCRTGCTVPAPCPSRPRTALTQSQARTRQSPQKGHEAHEGAGPLLVEVDLGPDALHAAKRSPAFSSIAWTSGSTWRVSSIRRARAIAAASGQ